LILVNPYLREIECLKFWRWPEPNYLPWRRPPVRRPEEQLEAGVGICICREAASAEHFFHCKHASSHLLASLGCFPHNSNKSGKAMHGFVERVARHGKLNVDLKASASAGTEDGRERTNHESDVRIGFAGTLERSPEIASLVA
jgi:hypothetical protein